MFNRKKKEEQKPTVRRPKAARSSQKIHSYYTAQQVDADTIRSAKKRKASTNNLLKSAFLQRLAVIVFIIFVMLTVSVISDEPIISFGGTQSITSVDRYSQDIQSLLGSSFLNANKFTLKRESLEAEIKNRFPELASVDVSTVVLGKKPLVQLTLHDLPLSYSSNGEVYLVAANGVVVGKQADFPLAKKSLLVKDDSSIPIKKSDIVLRSDDVTFLSTLTSVTKAKGREVEYVRITSVPREVFVKPTDKSYEIRMYLDEDVLQQIGSWFSVEKVVGEAGGEGPTRYIDVRAGEKVFWL